MSQPEDTTISARGARITYHLLLRLWTGLPGLTTPQVRRYLGLAAWTGADYLMGRLSQYPELPVYKEGKLWLVRFEPRDIVPAPVAYTALQRASLVTQRLVCRALLDDIDGLTVDEIGVLLGMKPRGVTCLMESVATRWGAPAWDFGDTWYIMLENFYEFPKSLRTA